MCILLLVSSIRASTEAGHGHNNSGRVGMEPKLSIWGSFCRVYCRMKIQTTYMKMIEVSDRLTIYCFQKVRKFGQYPFSLYPIFSHSLVLFHPISLYVSVYVYYFKEKVKDIWRLGLSFLYILFYNYIFTSEILML